MGVRSFLTDLFDNWSVGTPSDPGPSVNPATGLPMMGGMVDAAGNPFGVDLHRHDDQIGAPVGGGDDHHHRSCFDDHWSGSAGPIGTGWDSSSSSSSGTSDPWPDHSSSSPSGGYDPFRGW